MNSIIHLNEPELKEQLKTLVRNSVEETLNAYLDAEADRITGATRYERSPGRQDTRVGHYHRKLLTASGIERYRRRESSVEEALMEMYLAEVSVRRMEDITEALWGAKVSSGTLGGLNQKTYAHIEEWRSRPLSGTYPYVYLDGICLKRHWGEIYENVSVLIALGVNGEGCREILGAVEGGREDTAPAGSCF